MMPGVSNYNTAEHVWMVAKCTIRTLNDITTVLCENPGHDGSVESIVPVCDPSSGVHYRNKYCAVCNGVPVGTILIKWKLKINNDRYLAFPDKYILTKLQELKGNIFFIAPEYLFVETCSWPSYKIATCNETGLWSKYNGTIEEACHAFVDPFNLTYQNYFCYLCNSPVQLMPPTSWACSTSTLNFIDLLPPFSVQLDVSAITGDQEDETLVCDSGQIADYDKVRIQVLYQGCGRGGGEGVQTLKQRRFNDV